MYSCRCRKLYFKIFIIFIINIMFMNGCSSKSTSNAQQSSKISKNTINFSNPEINYTAGVLLGLKSELNGTCSYRTLWIAPQNDKLKVIAEGNFILTPYGNDFWMIKPQKAVLPGNSYVTYFDFYPVNSEPKELKFTLDNSINIEINEFTLMFVGNKYVSMSEYNYSYDKKTDDYIKNNSVFVTDLDKLKYDSINPKTISFQDIFKESGKEIVDKYLKENITKDESLSNNAINITDESKWSIVRNDGKWKPTIAKSYQYNTENSVEYGYNLKDVPLELPEPVGSFDEVVTDFNNIKEQIPEAVDAISSPKEDFVLVIFKDKILAYACTNKITGKTAIIGSPVLEIKLKSDETMIMDQWATDDYVSQWTKEITKYLKVTP